MAGLATPQVVVNNEVVGIKPNSLSYTEGNGDRNVRVKSTGGGAKTIVTTRDVETEMSMVKFTLLTEGDEVEKVREWLNNIDTNSIQISDGSFTRSFAQAIVTNNPEPALGVDGEMEVEFQSQPAV